MNWQIKGFPVTITLLNDLSKYINKFISRAFTWSLEHNEANHIQTRQRIGIRIVKIVYIFYILVIILKQKEHDITKIILAIIIQ